MICLWRVIVTYFAGIGNRAIRPTLGLVDPLNTMSMPKSVATYSGFDVLWSAFDFYITQAHIHIQINNCEIILL